MTIIRTREEESALPDDSILLGADGCAYQSRGNCTWATGGDDSWYCTVPLPARVLWLPSEGLPTDTPEDQQ